MFFTKVTILGVGLVGASYALALRESGLCETISGYGRNEDNLRRAKALGIIDDYSLKATSACEDSDLIVLAAPVGIFERLAGEIRDSARKGSVVTDVGSVKGRLVYRLESLMPEGVSYIGSHPIAGSDKSGIDDARADLFRGARCIVTPTGNSDKNAKDTIVSLWEKLGSRVEVMDPYEHDRIYAAVSHFPHIIAYALVNTVNDFREGCIEYAGQGFKDSTRIALSSPELWEDISIFNKDNLLRLTEILRKNLNRIEGLLVSEDAEGIKAEFSKARESRMKLNDH